MDLNLLHSASVPIQGHPQLQKTGAFEPFQCLRGLSGIGVTAPQTLRFNSSSLILAQQHGKVETCPVIQLVVHLQTGAVDLDQRRVRHQS